MTQALLSSSTSKPGTTAAARSANKATASSRAILDADLIAGSGIVNGGTASTDSPLTLRASRLVARIRTSGQALS
ncbi:hypothetical protein, partial [Nocardia sp. NPDC004711]